MVTSGQRLPPTRATVAVTGQTLSSLAEHESNKVAFLDGRAAPAEHAVAVAAEPFLRLGNVGVAVPLRRQGHRTDGLAGAGTAGLRRVIGMAAGAGRRIGLAAGGARQEQRLAA